MTGAPMTASEGPRPDLPIIGVVGAGVMGSGIAQVALEAGHEVVLHDVDGAALARARDRIADGLTRRAARALSDPAGIDDWVGARVARLRESGLLEQLGDEADVVVEAALESLELKETIFRTLDAVAEPATILATNTSAISIASIAAATRLPERVVGLHFFNPAPLMALVEVVAGPATVPRVAAAAAELVTSWGKTAVRSADAPGFIVNRVNRPFTLRALRLLEAGAAGVEAIDAAIREAGFPLGPFELMDLTGIDVTFAASTGIWEGLGRPDRLRPSPIQAELIVAGRLGRKTGEGFYRYEGGKRVGVADRTPAEGFPGRLGPDGIRDRILLPIVDEAHRAATEPHPLAAPAWLPQWCPA
ncbi:MAG TPA: 3-hydroxyacyl-CoA dehydrogenase NAD-binding domain-containing protein, partial [Candidatus Deferrimicrobium sp.]|nr:3-hydroxyacyl-CoA dehydrogenase NAD-binding domain-containing protein [Candidatus Deferrimicrobium sp.]